MIAGVFRHIKCINGKYPGSPVDRQPVPEGLVHWHKNYPLYNPPYYDARALVGKPWADPQTTQSAKWNQLDGTVDRRSHCGEYAVVNGFPRNPWGRTGLRGRGLLGRWGPNHAADPIVTRWKRSDSGDVVMNPGTGL
jgi:ADP-ribose pyrophosphatase